MEKKQVIKKLNKLIEQIRGIPDETEVTIQNQYEDEVSDWNLYRDADGKWKLIVTEKWIG